MYFSILPHIVLVNGRNKSALFDVEEGAYVHVPQEIYRCLVKRTIPVSDLNIDEEWKSFMLENGFAIETDFIPDFGSIDNLDFDIPFDYETLVIDANVVSDALRYIQAMPSERLSRYTQVRIFDNVHSRKLETIIELLNSKSIYNIELVFNWSKNDSEENLKKMLDKYNYCLSKLIVMGYKDITYNNRLFFNKKRLTDSSQCGICNENLLSINVETYNKFLLGNTCLWKKIAIDINGNVKNCPSMDFDYGSVFNIDLKDVKNNPRYQFFSLLRKNEISDCKDCEFRVFCVDCRCKCTNEIYDKPNTCDYNP